MGSAAVDEWAAVNPVVKSGIREVFPYGENVSCYVIRVSPFDFWFWIPSSPSKGFGGLNSKCNGETLPRLDPLPLLSQMSLVLLVLGPNPGLLRFVRYLRGFGDPGLPLFG